ncbi:hypothetical protein F4859DRAFT_516666 [Xylaria cf. heliscus]|nr:hypothetical protein F4859DRAFT_516666 [Xylaria cf. heliscus]
MSVLSPRNQHDMAMRMLDASPEIFANKQQLCDNRSPNLDSSMDLGKPAADPIPPRPLTPGPRPGPIPPQPPVPTPPPTPQNRGSLTIGKNNLDIPQHLLSPTVGSVSEPGIHQCPYPNPPPSPVPHRPGPVRPRPDVPTPPPSPRRSHAAFTTTNDPLMALSTVSSCAVLVLEYLASTTWLGQDNVSTAVRDVMTSCPSYTAWDSRIVHKVPQSVTSLA